MKAVEWSEQARADLRALDRPAAIRILEALTRFLETGHGDVRKLQGTKSEYRLRVGDWRVRFADAPGVIRILRVLHRKDAYR